MRKLYLGAWCAIVLAVCSAASCRRQPVVSAEIYREAVTAFHVSLAAMQTSQDLLARRELERLTGLVPEEPAGWANLGLLPEQQQAEICPAGGLLGDQARQTLELSPREQILARLHGRERNVEGGDGLTIDFGRNDRLAPAGGCGTEGQHDRTPRPEIQLAHGQFSLCPNSHLPTSNDPSATLSNDQLATPSHWQLASLEGKAREAGNCEATGNPNWPLTLGGGRLEAGSLKRAA